jgi:hypothetical protein
MESLTKDRIDMSRHYYIEIGSSCLTIETSATDLSQKFEAKCLELEGKKVTNNYYVSINGWLIDYVEQIDK